MEARKNSRGKLNYLKSEKGYLLFSTLFLLIFSGIFSQGVIRISSNHIIQLKQISSAYQAKTSLNMSKELLNKYSIDNHYELPESGRVRTSVGDVVITKVSENTFKTVVTLSNNVQYSEDVIIEIPEIVEEEIQEEEELEEELLPGTNNEGMDDERVEDNLLEEEIVE